MHHRILIRFYFWKYCGNHSAIFGMPKFEDKHNCQILSMMNPLHEKSGTLKDPLDYIIYGMGKFGKKSYIPMKLKVFWISKFLPCAAKCPTNGNALITEEPEFEKCNCDWLTLFKSLNCKTFFFSQHVYSTNLSGSEIGRRRVRFKGGGCREEVLKLSNLVPSIWKSLISFVFIKGMIYFQIMNCERGKILAGNWTQLFSIRKAATSEVSEFKDTRLLFVLSSQFPLFLHNIRLELCHTKSYWSEEYFEINPGLLCFWIIEDSFAVAHPE